MDNKMIDLTNINDSKLDSQFDLESEGSSSEVLEVKTSEVSSNSTVPFIFVYVLFLFIRNFQNGDEFRLLMYFLISFQ